MLDPIEEEGITIGIERIDRMAVEKYHPICMICAGSITEKDIHCIRIDIPSSGTIERLHDSEDCFNMYITALAYFYSNRPNVSENLISSYMQ